MSSRLSASVRASFLTWLLVVLLALASSVALPAQEVAPLPSRTDVAPSPWNQAPIDAEQARALFHQAWSLVRDQFYDRYTRGLDWSQVERNYDRELGKVQTRGDLSRLINRMLAELHTSHTAHYGLDDPMYYILASTFGPRAKGFPKSVFPDGKIMFMDGGFFTESHPEGTFVRSVLEGGPAAKAGMLVGDRLLSVDGSPYAGTASWKEKTGRAVPVEVERLPGGPALRLSIQPRWIDPQQAYLDAATASKHVIERNGRKIGYIHVWAFTDERIVPLVHDVLAGDFKNCDGFILDLRDGIGGGNFDFFLPWATGIPRITFVNRGGETSDSPPRPPPAMAIIINEGSRSAKEIYAYGFKKYHDGKLVGSNTAGFVTGGRAYYLDDGSLLYLAVAKVLVDGENLEGKGVSPDIPVKRDIPYAAGRDPQMDAAVNTVLETLSTSAPR